MTIHQKNFNALVYCAQLVYVCAVEHTIQRAFPPKKLKNNDTFFGGFDLRYQEHRLKKQLIQAEKLFSGYMIQSGEDVALSKLVDYKKDSITCAFYQKTLAYNQQNRFIQSEKLRTPKQHLNDFKEKIISALNQRFGTTFAYTLNEEDISVSKLYWDTHYFTIALALSMCLLVGLLNVPSSDNNHELSLIEKVLAWGGGCVIGTQISHYMDLPKPLKERNYFQENAAIEGALLMTHTI